MPSTGILDGQSICVLAAVWILYLLVRYPDRWVGTSPLPPGTVNHLCQWPILGDAWQLFWQVRKDLSLLTILHGFQTKELPAGEAHKQEWPRSVTVPGLGRMTYTTHPEHLEYMHKTAFDNFIKGYLPRGLFGDFIGASGIFLADGDVWRAQRKLANHVFAVGKVDEFSQTVIIGELETLHSLIGSIAQAGAYVNLQDIFMRFTLSAFGRIAFDHRFDSLPPSAEGLEAPDAFAEALDTVQQAANRRLYNPLWRLSEKVRKTGRQAGRSRKMIHSVVYDLIDQRLAQRASQGDMVDGGSSASKDLLGLFIDHVHDRRQLCETTLSFLFAGRDTTAQALSWLFYELTTHPDVVSRCRDEILAILGPIDAQRPMTLEDVGTMPYLNAAFFESLRLHPSVPKNMKLCRKDEVLPGIKRIGCPPIPIKVSCLAVESRTLNLIKVRAPARIDRLLVGLGDFLDGDGKLKRFSPYVMHAFNAGYRACLGSTLATFEAMAVTAAVLGQWDVQLKPGTETPRPGPSLTLPIANPYKVTFKALV